MNQFPGRLQYCLQRMTVPSKSFAVALFYFVCSISMNFLNKAVVSSYNFNYPFTIMACQMAVTILFFDTIRLSGLTRLGSYTLKDGIEFLGASVSFAIHSTLSLVALHGMNIPMYGAVKRCTPLVNLILSVTILKKPMPSRLLCLSIGVITLGVFIAGLGDLQFDAYAYTMGSLSVLAQASYMTLVQKSFEFHHKSTLEMIYINAYNTMPIFLTMSLILGEPEKVATNLMTEDSSFYAIFCILIVSGSVLTYAQFLCASICGALTTSIVSVSKSILQTLVGFYTFGGVKFHPLNVSGLLLNVFGGILYTYVKRLESVHKARKRNETKEEGAYADELDGRKLIKNEGVKPGERLVSASLSMEDENRNKKYQVRDV